MWVYVLNCASLGVTEIQTHLSASTGRSTWNTSLLAIDLMYGQVGVRWALLALIGFFLNVVAWGAGDTRWARLFRTKGTGTARGRHPIYCISGSDRINLHHVIDEPSILKREQKVMASASGLNCTIRLFYVDIIKISRAFQP